VRNALLRALLRDDHSSSPGLATGIERPTRGLNPECGSHRNQGAPSCEGAQRAGPALPSYLVLHHAGFAVPAPLLMPRWALTPPFHPCLRSVPFEDVPKVFLQAITGIRSAGGMFSVALSVNSSTGLSLCCLLRRQPRPIAAKITQTEVCATEPLALPGALPYGVRTFLPPPW
jgi:hypothetical protein